MKKSIKSHLHKHIFNDIFFIIIFLGISYLVYCWYNDYHNNIKESKDYSNYDNALIEAYNINSSLFNFDKKNTAIIEISTLLQSITNGKETMNWGEVPFTKEQDQCVGYIIVKKENKNFKFDYSHICDMVDY